VSARSLTLKVTTLVEILSAVFGFSGSIPLIADPSGKILGMSTSQLSGLPVSDFLIPGLFLFVMYGCGCSLAAYGLWTRRSWGLTLAAIVSLIWIGWVSFELYYWGVHISIWPWLGPPIVALLLLSRVYWVDQRV
jgi:hypothetical protein